MACKDLPPTIDIGGEIIYLEGTTANMNLAFKGREYFQKTFKPTGEDECILRRYMYHTLGPRQELDFKSTSDKDRLIEILEARKKQLWDSIQTPSNTVIKNNLTRFYRGITTFLNEIKGITPPPDREPYEQCSNEKAVLDEIKEEEDRIAEMLLQVTWYLMNPDGIPKDIQCDWAKMVQKLKGHTTFADVKQALALPNSKKKALNYFKRVDLKTFGAEKNHKKAIKAAKSMMAVEPSEDVMKNRLTQIMTLLSLKNYVKGPLNNPSEQNIAAIADTLPSKLVDIGLPLQQAFLPMKSFLKSMYDPVYTLLKARTPTKSESLMAILLILLHICNTIPKSETMYGVYRINGVPEEGLKWVKDQLVNPNPATATADDHAKKMYYLSKLSLPILTKQDGELQTIGASINTTPYFQFGIIGTNLKVKPSDTLTDKDINRLFPENTLFLFVTKSEGFASFTSTHTNIPATFYSIDYTQVDPKASTTVTPIVSPFTNTPKVKMDELKVDQFITIDPNLACNHSNLVLSIFFLLDSRLGGLNTPFWTEPVPTAPAKKASTKKTSAKSAATPVETPAEPVSAKPAATESTAKTAEPPAEPVSATPAETVSAKTAAPAETESTAKTAEPVSATPAATASATPPKPAEAPVEPASNKK